MVRSRGRGMPSAAAVARTAAASVSVRKAKEEKSGDDGDDGNDGDDLRRLLKSLGPAYLGYESTLRDDGYETMGELRELELEDMLEAGMKKGHAKRLLRAVQSST